MNKKTVKDIDLKDKARSYACGFQCADGGWQSN